MSNDEGIAKHESRTAWQLQHLRPFLDFVIRICFVIGHSDFVIPLASEPAASITDHEQEQAEMITLSV
jgi:hypothetical protein